MAKSWHDYYQGHNKIIWSNIFLHWSYLISILLNHPKKVLEIGCGTADHSVFISYILPGVSISVLDFDKEIVASLKKNQNKRINNFYICDILNEKMVEKLGFQKKEFDVIYSQGLLEHFSEKDLQKIINHFLPFTKKFIFSIPSEAYPNLDYGNELLRSRKELKDIFKENPNIVYKINKYCPDIGLRTKLMTVKKKRMGIISALHFILFDSCHYLIEIKSSSI